MVAPADENIFPTDGEDSRSELVVMAHKDSVFGAFVLGLLISVCLLCLSRAMIDPDWATIGKGQEFNSWPPTLRAAPSFVFALVSLFSSIRWFCVWRAGYFGRISSSGIEVVRFFEKGHFAWSQVRCISIRWPPRFGRTAYVRFHVDETVWDRLLGGVVSFPSPPLSDTKMETTLSTVARFRPDLVSAMKAN